MWYCTGFSQKKQNTRIFSIKKEPEGSRDILVWYTNVSYSSELVWFFVFPEYWECIKSWLWSRHSWNLDAILYFLCWLQVEIKVFFEKIYDFSVFTTLLRERLMNLMDFLLIILKVFCMRYHPWLEYRLEFLYILFSSFFLTHNNVLYFFIRKFWWKKIDS